METITEAAAEVKREDEPIEVMLCKYEGQALISRLQYLVESAVPEALPDLFRVFISALKSSKNTTALREVLSQRSEVIGGAEEMGWVAATDNEVKKQLSSLREQLAAMKQRARSDNIGEIFAEIARVHAAAGQIPQALSNYSSALELASGELVATYEYEMAHLHIHSRQYVKVLGITGHYVRQTKAPHGADRLQRMRLLHAIGCMAMGKENEALNTFLEVSYPWHPVPDICTEEDFANYTMLCLAHVGHRATLRQLIDQDTSSLVADGPSSDFPRFLIEYPQLRGLLHNLYYMHYGAVLRSFKNLSEYYKRDMFLIPRLHLISDNVRKRALSQYVRPYSRLQLGTIALVFDLPEDVVLHALVDLIEAGSIDARLDWEQRMLVRKETPLEQDMLESVLKASSAYQEKAAIAFFQGHVKRSKVRIRRRNDGPHG
eukprot:CAMPEP_0119136902 /NCGR_PEP_ID=MMETSP1310-20130426/22393_1 /TAXON_ID=464262 /ORGANISM="Genus nov. species nov., Strain RCC2339" /LENGTH=431 /DNA_ID=CAMNT_0007127941 /DNA_START=33 /DNA_END=1325 /DNA_ORIENTATION=+